MARLTARRRPAPCRLLSVAALALAGTLLSEPLRTSTAFSAVAPRIKKKAKPVAVVGDAEIEKFYEETISGDGGMPSGIERDLITKFFGDGNDLGVGDHEAAYTALRERMESGESFVGSDDGKGWVWLVADMSKADGLYLEVRKSTPVGLRPMLVAKADNVGEAFDKVNWTVARRRLGEVMGRRDERGRKPGQLEEQRLDKNGKPIKTKVEVEEENTGQ